MDYKKLQYPEVELTEGLGTRLDENLKSIPIIHKRKVAREDICYGLEKSGDVLFSADHTVYKHDKTGALRRLTPKKGEKGYGNSKTKK